MNTQSGIITAPTDFSAIPRDRREIFLAGSIEMGKAIDWQMSVTHTLAPHIDAGQLRIYNPRRSEWDASWSQDGTHPELEKQIQWELRALERADTILFYFDPATLSPISLLELGLHARSGKAIIVCPPGFWRRANVVTTAAEYRIPYYDTIDDAVQRIVDKINNVL